MPGDKTADVAQLDAPEEFLISLAKLAAEGAAIVIGVNGSHPPALALAQLTALALLATNRKFVVVSVPGNAKVDINCVAGLEVSACLFSGLGCHARQCTTFTHAP